jgi:hypothetical protein
MWIAISPRDRRPPTLDYRLSPSPRLPDIDLGEDPVAEVGDLRAVGRIFRLDQVIGEVHRQHDIEGSDQTPGHQIVADQGLAA